MPLLLRVLSASVLFISLLANAASLDVSKLQAGEVQYLQWHGMLEPVPKNSYRLTSYTWLIPIK